MSFTFSHGGVPVELKERDPKLVGSPYAKINNPTLKKAKKILEALKEETQRK